MKHVYRIITHWALLLHIYVSMAGFALTLLFGITGLTLNHQDFGHGDPKIESSMIDVPPILIDHPDKNSIEKHLQQTLGIAGPVTDYHEDPDQIQMTFAAPGHRTVVTINRERRSAEVEKENRGVMGKLDDLHKGFDSGRAWYWMIDFAAVLLTISALTGMITLLSLRARRRSGLLIGSLGIATVLLIYFMFVPQ